MKTIKTLLTTALTLVATTAPVLACGYGLVRMYNHNTIYNNLFNGKDYGEVCYAETGNVYLRYGDLSYSANRTLSNGTRFRFIDATMGYAKVRVISTGQTGWITIRYTCSYNS